MGLVLGVAQFDADVFLGHSNGTLPAFSTSCFDSMSATSCWAGFTKMSFTLLPDLAETSR